jgi:hypothetical protein
MSIFGRRRRISELFKRIERFERSAEFNPFNGTTDAELLDLAADLAADAPCMAALDAGTPDDRALAGMVRGLLSTWRRDDGGQWERIQAEQTPPALPIPVAVVVQEPRVAPAVAPVASVAAVAPKAEEPPPRLLTIEESRYREMFDQDPMTFQGPGAGGMKGGS